ncbi:MAG: efflux RND transporter periplasmic adaptor subunit [Deltaproteobacteria bacterium]|nr:efflux RND transporter periplasmic adaptor subunit [Deltaproteobacteria bacterium]MBW1860848.1 efflux RND transporter periplasmic adaptor subunit [Deltaproteobacteria bacterium]
MILGQGVSKNMIKSQIVHRILLVLVVAVSVFNCNVTLLFAQDASSISGITESIRDVTLSASVSGRISEIFLEEGDRVDKGQLILNLEKKLEGLEVQRRKLLWESKVEVESAARTEATLKSLFDSTRMLFESTKSVSREELEKLELEYLLSVAERRRLEIAEQRERIEYDLALENLEKRSLRSPIQGIIIKLLIKEGEGCEPDQPLIRLVDPDRCLFICNVEERIGRTLKKGQSVNLKIRTGASSVKKIGTIVFASPVVDPASGLLEVKAKFDNHDGKVRPGVSGFMTLRRPNE